MSDLTAATSYAFTVRTCDAAGNRSAAAPGDRPHPGRPATQCDVRELLHHVRLGTGYVGQFTVSNPTSEPVKGWRVAVELPASSTITSTWSALVARSGTSVVFTPESWTATIPRAARSRSVSQVAGSAKPFCKGCC